MKGRRFLSIVLMGFIAFSTSSIAFSASHAKRHGHKRCHSHHARSLQNKDKALFRPHASMRKAKKTNVRVTRTVRKVTQKVFRPHASMRKAKRIEKKFVSKMKHLSNYFAEKWNL
jgi:hypothetical protein